MWQLVLVPRSLELLDRPSRNIELCPTRPCGPACCRAVPWALHGGRLLVAPVMHNQAMPGVIWIRQSSPMHVRLAPALARYHVALMLLINIPAMHGRALGCFDGSR